MDARIILGLLLLSTAGFIVWGLGSGTKVETPVGSTHDCTIAIEGFSQEYGKATKVDGFFVDSSDVYFYHFGQGWTVPLRGSNCGIVEDVEEAKDYFQLGEFRQALPSTDSSLFSSTRDCWENANAKGASNACGLTSTIDSAASSPVTEVVIKVPTSDTRQMAQKITGSEWTAQAVGTGVNLVKQIEKTGVLSEISLVQDVSCKLATTPKKAVWDLADQGNVVFTHARAGYFSRKTVANLYTLSEGIVVFSPMEFEVQFSNPPATNDPIASVTNALGSAWDVGTSAFSKASETLAKVSGGVVNPACAAGAQVQKFKKFQEVLTRQSYLTAHANFYGTLNTLKTNAQAAMKIEQNEKEKNWPNPLLLMFFPTKAAYYLAHESSAGAYFSQQKYLSAKQVAEYEVPFYQNYWKNAGVFDILASILIGLILIFAVQRVRGRGNRANEVRTYEKEI